MFQIADKGVQIVSLRLNTSVFIISLMILAAGHRGWRKAGCLTDLDIKSMYRVEELFSVDGGKLYERATDASAVDALFHCPGKP